MESLSQKVVNLLNPKKLVIDAIKSKLENQNIEKIILVFSIADDKYSVSLKTSDNSSPINFDISPNDITLLKRIFVTKIYKTLDNQKNVKAIILQFDLIEENFDIFIQTLADYIYKYNYSKFTN